MYRNKTSPKPYAYYVIIMCMCWGRGLRVNRIFAVKKGNVPIDFPEKQIIIICINGANYKDIAQPLFRYGGDHRRIYWNF